MRTLSDHELIAGLNKVSPNFSFRGAGHDHDGHWYPGATASRPSFGLYYNFAATGADNYISGISTGRVGPFDTVTPKGRVVARGFLVILRRVVLGGYASKSALESIFGLSLGEPKEKVPEILECGCEFTRGAPCRHSSTPSNAIADAPGVIDDRFHSY